MHGADAVSAGTGSGHWKPSFMTRCPMRKPVLELLESRRLFSAGFEAHINFQPASATIPSGFLADSGAPYQARGGALTYGWNTQGARVVNRNVAGVDPLYDTF